MAREVRAHDRHDSDWPEAFTTSAMVNVLEQTLAGNGYLGTVKRDHGGERGPLKIGVEDADSAT